MGPGIKDILLVTLQLTMLQIILPFLAFPAPWQEAKEDHCQDAAIISGESLGQHHQGHLGGAVHPDVYPLLSCLVASDDSNLPDQLRDVQPSGAGAVQLAHGHWGLLGMVCWISGG